MTENNSVQDNTSTPSKLKKNLRNFALLFIGIAVAYAITTFLA